MRNFDYSELEKSLWDSEIIGLIAQIHEYKGRQELYLKQKPAELDRLIEIAKVQSTEASNEIEGIRTTNTRLLQLVKDKTTPRNRDEEEIIGYRDVLNTIHENYEYIPITSNYILQLHKILLSHTDSDFGGKFKNVQNYISATDEKGNRFTLFTPLAPFETEEAMGRICEEYNRAIGEGKVDPLLILPVFIHDFLCIHPFIDGNGRLSRLLTTLLLYRAGYEIGKYISLEAKIAKHKDAYYSSLERSQVDWHDGKDDPTDFVKYFLSTIIAAYRDFDERIAMIAPSSFEIVKSAVEKKIGRFSKRDIMELCPTLSASTVERHLKKMLNAGSLEKLGAGRATIYIRK